MPSKSPPPAILPYRDVNNTSVRYTAAPDATTTQPLTNYDSDFEPLISSPSANLTELSEHDLMHFTATGRPAPAFKPSALSMLGAGDSYTVPQLLPKRYTDDSIIPAIIVNVIPSPKPVSAEEESRSGRRKSIFGKFKGDRRKNEIGPNGFIKMKVVYMPRRDYLKWFARDLKGDYIGSDPFRQWSEEELEREFGQYQPPPPPKVKGFDPFRIS
jgi:hypothetical protein